MTQDRDDLENEADTEEFEVVDLESEEGEKESFVILDQFDLNEAAYVLLIALEDFEKMEEMSEEEIQDAYGEQGFFHIMRVDGEDFTELDEEEFALIKDDLYARIDALGE